MKSFSVAAIIVCNLVSILILLPFKPVSAFVGPPPFTQRALYRAEASGSSYGDSVSLSPNGDSLCISNLERETTGGTWVINRNSEYAQASPRLLVYVSGELDHIQSGTPCDLSNAGNVLVFGGYVDVSGLAVGAVWVWAKNATGGYSGYQRLTDPGNAESGFGLGLSISDDGLTLAVYRPASTPPAVFIYSRTALANPLTLETTTSGLVFTGDAALNAFVMTLSGDGNRVFFAADNADSGKGAVMYYRRSAPNTWTSIARITVSTTTGFGTTVGTTFDGGLLAVGTRATESNSIFVYSLNTQTNQYALLQTLNTAGRLVGDNPASYSLALSINKLVISDRTGQSGIGVITTYTHDYTTGTYSNPPQSRTFATLNLQQVGNDMDISRDGQVLTLAGQQGDGSLGGVFVLSLDPTLAPSRAPTVTSKAPTLSPTTLFSPTSSPVTRSPATGASVSVHVVSGGYRLLLLVVLTIVLGSMA